jgi:hypothetical protein
LRSADDHALLLEARSICPYLIRCLTVALLVFLASGSICFKAFGQLLQPENQPNTVHGTVINAVTHNPIGRALVYSPDNRYATLTDGEGHFEFTLPKGAADTGSSFSFEGQPSRMWSTGTAGLTWLMARKPGFLDDSSERSQVEASPGTELTISLMPEGLIKGRVTFSAADPANRVNVQLFWRQVQDGSPRWQVRNSARTNSNGEFRFAELQPGSYKLLTSEWMDNDPEGTVPGGQLYGFPPVYYPSATDFASASTIPVAAGQIFQADLSLVRQPYYPVRIPVTNTEQSGGMNITVSLQGQHSPGYSLGYNRGKETVEGQLPNGKYVIEAATYGPNSASGSVNIAVAGAPVEGPGMVIAGNNSISLNVKEEFTSNEGRRSGSWSDGKHTYPMHGLRLDIQISAVSVDDFGAQRSGSIRQPTGPNDDSLVLENLAPGRYWLRLHAARGYVASATMGGVDLLREPLVVVPGANPSIDITMRDDNAEIEGTLLGVPPTAVDSIRSTPPGYVYCIPLPDSPGQFLELAASSDGKFGHQMVAPGVYRVIAFSGPQRDLPYRDAEAMKLYETNGQVVHFAPGQKVSLQLEITSRAE